MTDLVEARQPFIDGEWVRGSGDPVQVQSPATGEVVATVEGASAEQVAQAIAAARRAFDEGPWPRLAPAEGVKVVQAFGEALEARRHVLVETVIEEAGCPRSVTELTQVGMALSSIRELAEFYAGLPEWEYNEATVFGEAAEDAGLPPGVLNVVVEQGNEGGVLLTTHRDVDTQARHPRAGRQERRAEVVDAIAAASATLTIGPPTEASTLVGPLISQAQRGRVDALVQQSVSEGARLAAGGRAPDGRERGAAGIRAFQELKHVVVGSR